MSMKTLKQFWGGSEPPAKRARTSEATDGETCGRETAVAKGDPSVIVTWNANGLVQRIKNHEQWDAFCGYVSQLKPDVICMQEVKLAAQAPRGAKQGDSYPRQRGVLRTSEESYDAEAKLVAEAFRQAPMNQYQLRWSLSDWRYSGVLMAIKNTIQPGEVTYDLRKLPPWEVTSPRGPRMTRAEVEAQDAKRKEIPTSYTHHPEGRVICAEFETFHLLTLYTPNNGTDHKKFDARTEFDARVREHAVYYVDGAKPLIIVGDLNCAPSDVDLSHPAWFRAQIITKHPPPVCLGQPGCTEREREQFFRILRNGQLTDAYRMKNNEKTPPPVEANAYTWRGTAGRETRMAGKYYAKGMRIDHVLIKEEIEDRVAECYITGYGADRVKFFGSDHSPVVVKLKPATGLKQGEDSDSQAATTSAVPEKTNDNGGEKKPDER